MTSPMTIHQLVHEVRVSKISLTADSRRVSFGGVFVALPPALPRPRMAQSPGGEQYLSDAIRLGARYIVLEEQHAHLAAEHLAAGATACFVVCPDAREALGLLAGALYGTDEACPKIIGITGTNGKTTSTYILEHLLVGLGFRVGVIGTVSYHWPGFFEPAPLTTPGCVELHAMLAKMQDDGVDYVLMEVSSHALDQGRVAGLAFCAALLTNVTQDHLDYHTSMEEYFAAKKRLFLSVSQGGYPDDRKAGAANADDSWCRTLLGAMPSLVGYGIREAPVAGTRHLKGEIKSLSSRGMHLSMTFEGQQWDVSSSLTGSFNAMNLLGVQALCLALGFSYQSFAHLEGFAGVPGRLERIENTKGYNVFVDYAHTPDALVNALAALRAAGFKRIITVFGCGGNRDRAKRPLMGEAVAANSDVALLTSDNPRHEDPEAIMADVLPGLSGCKDVHCQADRRLALKEALDLLEPDDALLVAGKGHETYQQIGDRKLPFSDQSILQEYLECK